MLDDLEMQAEGLHLAERAVEVDELAVAQYAEVELLDRLHASVGRQVRVSTAGPDLRGELAAAGADWLLVDDGAGGAWFAQLGLVVTISGLAAGSLPEPARPMAARLSLRSILRRLARDRKSCALHLLGDRALHGVPLRVGADFVELGQDDAPEPVTVPLSAIAVVQDRP
jgi:hypothetical protein